MRRLVLQTGVSIDGFVAGLHGSHDWGYEREDDALKAWTLESVRKYEEMAAVWPTSTSDYAAPMNEIPKIVFSKTLQSADWPESHIARGDLAEEVAALKREPGND